MNPEREIPEDDDEEVVVDVAYESDGVESAVSSRDEDADSTDGRRVGFRARSPETEIASLVSRALVGDLQQLAAPSAAGRAAAASGDGCIDALGSAGATMSAVPKPKERVCCVCGSPAPYTCPGCGRRTCSITCVRVHKVDYSCSGERDVARKVPLAEFDDAQLQRDFRFLEDCRRVANNADRQLPRARRFNFKLLPPPLRALREAARRRGVVCQFMSDGMAKREANTSRYDRATNTVLWRCDFVFHKGSSENHTVSTNWGSERHRLGDIMRYCWATNPALPCYHINQTYNHSGKYVGAETRQASAEGTPHASEDDNEVNEHGSVTSEVEGRHSDGESLSESDPDDEEEAMHDELSGDDGSDAGEEDGVEESLGVGSTAQEAQETGVEEEGLMEADRGPHQDEDSHGITADPSPAEELPASQPPLSPDAVPAPPPVQAVMPEVSPATPQEVRDEALVREFIQTAGEGGWHILSKAERLGNETRYFLLNPENTLNENMRVLFFVNEYPVFEVVRTEDLGAFPLVTEADKEAIRASFKAKERTPEELLKRQHPGIRLKSDLDPEEAERLSRVPCRMNLQHRCVAGDNCPYWHCTLEEWPQCRAFAKNGRCPMGYRCSFRHGNHLPGEERPAPMDTENGFKRPRDGGRGMGRGRGGFGRGRGGRGRGRGFRRGH